ncbi:hypothetical protein [Pseudonocardia sp. MH-G8]|uniref:hypothetical protein n=1 Tax=Pseudonocardia sp. MH-G8 TaxID=1854588 RepID=UPI0013046939|nr:hypothetical protein [Pseudonocardia sp. MH-G8]
MSADLIETTVDGEWAALVAAEIPDGAPAAVREGIARRRLVVTQGECPCGAVFRPPPRAERRAAARTGRVLHVRVEHSDDCPAITTHIEQAWREAR